LIIGRWQTNKAIQALTNKGSWAVAANYGAER